MSSRNCPLRGGREPGANAIDADLAVIGAHLDLMTERVARLPGKRFYLIMFCADVALLSAVILFAEELRALSGI